MYQSGLSSIYDIDVTSNEYISKQSLNRNIKKLWENDICLYNMYNNLMNGAVIINYTSEKPYDYFQLVWYKCKFNNKLYLLRSLVDGNTQNPDSLYDKEQEKLITDTDNSYWKNENEYKTILDYGIDKKIQTIARTFLQKHQNVINHKYGELSSYDDLDKHILRRDFSNIDSLRDENIYPYRTVDFSNNDKSLSNVILHGYYREYSNKLVEYDIIFRVGYNGTETYGGEEFDNIQCNNLVLHNKSKSQNPMEYNENNRYFLNTGDYSIFNYKNESKNNFSVLPKSIEHNRNDYVNIYYATIQFPIYFRDLNYMIYNCNVLSQQEMYKETYKDISYIESCKNNMVFCNKTRKSVTALLITTPSKESEAGYVSTHGGLQSNSFHCKIIGWKE